VARLRDAIPGVAIHGDVIVGFPTEDDGAWRRSVEFIEGIEFAGIHVFRYSARPGTPAVRMAGQVDERRRKARANELLSVAAAARARFAAAQVGRQAAVLFESRLDDARWIGHAEDHTLVAVRPGDEPDLDNAIGRVAITGTDPDAPDRAVGRLLAHDRPARPLRRALPVLTSTSPGGIDAR
jgi:tRNA A37 methylthiotransferase MiaB